MIKSDSVFLQKALNAGRKIIPRPVFEFFQPWYHTFLAFSGAVLYRFPGRKLKIIGVTGTNGKTSVVHLATHIFQQNGYTVASLSSLRFSVADREWKNQLKMTMPGRLKMQRFMREAVNAGCSHLIMEVTSEGIRQNRHKAIPFDTTVFTNLTPEHIESHGSFEEYKKAKGKLFALPHRVSVVNVDDKNAQYFLSFDAKEKIGYSIGAKGAEKADCHMPNVKYLTGQNIEQKNDATLFSVNDIEFKIRLPGEFNVYNSLAAIAVAQAQDISLQKSAESLKTFAGIPGRLETVIGEPFSVVVDYAHTPDALKNVYKTLRNKRLAISDKQKMICVLGSAGGGRDKWKRPQMGEIAAEYCDEIILTNEDPYQEDPTRILSEIESGITNGQLLVTKVLDRRKAIRTALKKAKRGDIVVITGKGAEPLLMTKDGPVEWDDRRVVREEFEKLANTSP